jgi:hypothetical protein
LSGQPAGARSAEAGAESQIAALRRKEKSHGQNTDKIPPGDKFAPLLKLRHFRFSRL